MPRLKLKEDKKLIEDDQEKDHRVDGKSGGEEKEGGDAGRRIEMLRETAGIAKKARNHGGVIFSAPTGSRNRQRWRR